jgi:hypothetical protein
LVRGKALLRKGYVVLDVTVTDVRGVGCGGGSTKE